MASKPLRKQQTSTNNPANSGPTASNALRTRCREATIVSVSRSARSPPLARRPANEGFDQSDVMRGIRFARVKSARSRSPASSDALRSARGHPVHVGWRASLADFLFHQRQRWCGHLQSRPAVAPKQDVGRESDQPPVPADCGLPPIFFGVCRELSTSADGAEMAAVVARQLCLMRLGTIDHWRPFLL